MFPQLQKIMINTTVVYNHRGRIGADGTAPVEIRITINRKSYYINVGVRVRKSEWKFGKIVNRSDSDLLNDRVEAMLERVDTVVNEYLQRGEEINPAIVRQKVWSPDARKKIENDDVISWMNEQLGLLGVKIGTAKHYKCSITRVVESGIIRKWNDVTLENLHRWDAYLHGIEVHRTDAEIKAGKPVEYISQGTVRNYHKDINALLGRALKFGLIDRNPYERMKGEIKRGDSDTVEFLTRDELKRIEDIELTDGTMLAIARDLFIFQAYTGMGFSDMQAFNMGDCKQEDDRWLLAKRRVKTSVVYYVQLLQPALAVAQKYGGQLPRIAIQVYNRHLHALAEMVKIKKRVTSHVARHTFATWALHHNVPIERVSKMLGHANIRQTQRYAKVLAQDVYKEYDKLNESL